MGIGLSVKCIIGLALEVDAGADVLYTTLLLSLKSLTKVYSTSSKWQCLSGNLRSTANLSADVRRAAWASDLCAIGIQMQQHFMFFNQLDEVDKQQRPQKGSLLHTTQQTRDEWLEDAAAYVLCPIDEIQPKPSISSVFDVEGLLQIMQQDVVIDSVECCRQIEEDQSTYITTNDSL